MFRGDAHNIFFKNVNKIALSFNDDWGLQCFNRIKSCLYRSNVWKIHKEKFLWQRNKEI